MPEPIRQQDVEGIVDEDGNPVMCAGPNCGKPATRIFNNVSICSILSDCYIRYKGKIAIEKQQASYAEDMTLQRKMSLHQHNMGRGYPSIEHLERAYSHSSQSPTF